MNTTYTSTYRSRALLHISLMAVRILNWAGGRFCLTLALKLTRDVEAQPARYFSCVTEGPA